MIECVDSTGNSLASPNSFSIASPLAAKLVAFYRAIGIGFNVGQDEAGGKFALAQCPGLSAKFMASTTRGDFAYAPLYFLVDNLDSILATVLQNAGVISEINQTQTGRRATVIDPDGRNVVLIERPPFSDLQFVVQPLNPTSKTSVIRNAKETWVVEFCSIKNGAGTILLGIYFIAVMTGLGAFFSASTGGARQLGSVLFGIGMIGEQLFRIVGQVQMSTKSRTRGYIALKTAIAIDIVGAIAFASMFAIPSSSRYPIYLAGQIASWSILLSPLLVFFFFKCVNDRVGDFTARTLIWILLSLSCLQFCWRVLITLAPIAISRMNPQILTLIMLSIGALRIVLFVLYAVFLRRLRRVHV